ncbi:NADH-ubiquinone oxidoreductase 21kDa subunit [Cantharellus anzutake]|uniref:NADH-ubiquinone oxidoreductase 21kDa subunit n=1 Tax=Cantharellus anzutake TaxID=1750568 RepID=UPI00190571FF|nr:NADH-ubiquinone oxidoreductase 21kDa subunit [Cantharellus anzutake]KAF8335833.1 NADH-ubiquinone oxidoreductase 21kDa subunit [Cantharellus anzutake]
MSLLGTATRSLRCGAPVTRYLTGLRFESTSSHPLAKTDSSSSHEITPSEPKELITAEVVSGAPQELQHRSVRIYLPTRNTMQSGGAKGEKWRIDFDTPQGAGRWENPLMGWASSADYVQALRMQFNTKEDAIHFAEKQGWNYYVQPPTVKRIPPKAYADNFLYSPGKLRIAHTK